MLHRSTIRAACQAVSLLTIAWLTKRQRESRTDASAAQARRERRRCMRASGADALLGPGLKCKLTPSLDRGASQRSI